MDEIQGFLLYGLVGAFLAALIAMGATWLADGLNWWIVAGASAAGFVLCGLFKDRAIGWIGELLWYWWI